MEVDRRGSVSAGSSKYIKEELDMKFWQGLAITCGVVIVALIIYDKWVKSKIGATS